MLPWTSHVYHSNQSQIRNYSNGSNHSKQLIYNSIGNYSLHAWTLCFPQCTFFTQGSVLWCPPKKANKHTHAQLQIAFSKWSIPWNSLFSFGRWQFDTFDKVEWNRYHSALFINNQIHTVSCQEFAP